ncbi:hypothetical protein OE88DRAFT_481620 [Heliocybe sulcata]|uniref:DEAD/DEAH-box helicase domain-containing protein n=1 Tax=Heliocybe sulcata TaxID=5364 RepID=A0A5C3MT92_9AGAM|nr:hypothetical protein OE88DRAFT_481620 [Heliocybe sulcata]
MPDVQDPARLLPAPSRYVFSSVEGHKFCRSVLQELLPFDPHDYQLEGICKALDGSDVFAIAACGDGKTGYYYMFILMVLYITNNPVIEHPGVCFPRDPVIVIVCPTNGIEEQMAAKLKDYGLQTLAINSKTLHEASKHGENLWITARSRISMLMLSPEQLSNKGFKSLLDYEPFWRRVVALGVDEPHLLLTWGKSFHKSFVQ